MLVDKILSGIKKIEFKDEEKDRKYISFDLLKVLCSFGIIMINVSAIFGEGSRGWNLVQFLVRPSLGLLMVLIGYYSFKENTNNLIEFYKNKLVKVVLPLIVYIFVYFVIYLKPMNGLNIFEYIQNDSIGFTWFIFSVIEIIILMPLLLKGLKALNKTQIQLLLVIFFIVYTFISFITANNRSIGYDFSIIGNSSLLYFMLGYYLYNYKIKFSKKSFLLLLASIIVFIVDYKVKYLPVNYRLSLFIVLTIIFVMSLFEYINNKINYSDRAYKLISYLSNRVLGIYLIHSLIYRIITDYGLLVLGQRSAIKVTIMFILESIVIFIISIPIVIFIDRVVIKVIHGVYYKIKGKCGIIKSSEKRRIKA